MNFSIQTQQQSQWCWAACVVSINLFYNPSSGWTQCLLANAVFSQTDCCTNGGSAACNRPNHLAPALQITGNYDHTLQGKAALDPITREIRNCRPIGVTIAWDGGGAHAVVIYGYKYELLGAKIYIADPFYGNSLLRYSSFPANYQGGATWTITDFTKP